MQSIKEKIVIYDISVKSVSFYFVTKIVWDLMRGGMAYPLEPKEMN